jgi:hypothetical protein
LVVLVWFGWLVGCFSMVCWFVVLVWFAGWLIGLVWFACWLVGWLVGLLVWYGW